MVAPLTLSVLLTSAPPLPPDWDPQAAGDRVLAGLVRVSAPEVQGAHDADMVLVGDRAYIVAEANDVQPGHGAGRHEYCVLSVVDIRAPRLVDTIRFAHSAQAFANETLPVGACFVPRILRLDAHTLRCWFASEDPGRRQAQTWYRDFDLRRETFAPTIYRMELKTAAGTFDMQPRHLHADAVRCGFAKPAKDFGLYLFDTIKEFGGRLYVALNNYPGAQNALGVLNDARDCVEVLGHYHEPARLNLTESAVNRLPDGSWLAICRQEGGNRNYLFTTSPDGRAWTVAEERDWVRGGASSKPTFDRFGGVYYVGWQSSEQVQGVNRSVFHVDVSADGAHWARKYRFATTESFQYPTFRQHDGALWVCVTQGTGGSTDRIMFGRVE